MHNPLVCGQTNQAQRPRVAARKAFACLVPLEPVIAHGETIGVGLGESLSPHLVVTLARRRFVPWQEWPIGGSRDVQRELLAGGLEPSQDEHTSELQSPCNLVFRLLL